MSAVNMNANLGSGSRRPTLIQSALLSCFEHLAGVAVMATIGGAYLLRLLVDWGTAPVDNEEDLGHPVGTENGNDHGSESRRENSNGNGSENGNGGRGNGIANETESESGCETVTKDRNDRHHHHRETNQDHDTETDAVSDTQSPDEEDNQPRRRRAAGERGDWHRGANLMVQTKERHLISVVCGFAKDQEMYPSYIPGKFGEDAWFKTVTPRADIMGVADGVGSWRSSGVDPGVFSMFLMNACECMACFMDTDPKRPDMLLARAYFHLLEQKTPIVGSCTACIVALDRTTGILYAANLGDSGFMVVRGGKVVCRSEEQQHEFNTPFQLTGLPPEMDEDEVIIDGPEMADTLQFQTEPGDVLLLATDGVFDNLPEELLVEVLSEVAGVSDGVRLQMTANSMALMARSLSFDPDHDSPFSQHARMNDLDFSGGKPDDITLILASIC